jgi:conjugative relaxase-like TrwC/TraI family protein
MLRINQQSSAAAASGYYTTADYYTEGQELAGVWHGKGAERLGLSGEVSRDDWDALCNNRHPATGEKLTLRNKDNRTVGYDYNFHAPKSLSLLYGITRDSRILDAFTRSVDATMRDMEAEMQARVRKGNLQDDRVTANMVWGQFTHFTARPVDGIPDPHLHAHCFVFNQTYDAVEGAWKAGQFRDQKRDAPYFEAVFHSRLSRALTDLGLPIERTRSGWEIAGLSRGTLEKFSRRSAEIDAREEAIIEWLKKEKGIELDKLDAVSRDKLGAETRERKAKHLTSEDLREEWLSRLDETESTALMKAHHKCDGRPLLPSVGAVQASVAHAILHEFERKSVVPERSLLTTALKRGLGEMLPEQAQAELSKHNLIFATRHKRKLVTTREVLHEEQAFTEFARRGRGSCQPLAAGKHRFKREWLNASQRNAVEHILQSRDRVIAVRGAAGVGKTSMLQEAAEAIEASGGKVFAFAPSTDASRGTLRDEGFGAATTVAALLLDEKLQEEARGHVLLIDEAGLLGSKTMHRLFKIADRIDARVIVSGDIRQHASVERGSPLRMLEENAGIVPAELVEIQRQSGLYRDAVRALSEGDVETGLDRLDHMGWVFEFAGDERYRHLAAEYVSDIEENRKALVIAPTHAEGAKVTIAIREAMRARKLLGEEEHEFTQLCNLHLTEAERSDAANFSSSDVLVFHQNAKGFTRGQKAPVAAAKNLPLDQAARYQVFRKATIKLSVGDTIRITKNGRTQDDKHDLNNGTRYVIKAFMPDGGIELTNGWRVAKDFGFIEMGHVVTSHAAQGRTVARTYVAESLESFPAGSREQFYVSASRSTEFVKVFTNSKAELREAVSRSDERLTATDLIEQRARVAVIQRTDELMRQSAHHAARERHAVREVARI